MARHNIIECNSYMKYDTKLILILKERPFYESYLYIFFKINNYMGHISNFVFFNTLQGKNVYFRKSCPYGQTPQKANETVFIDYKI